MDITYNEEQARLEQDFCRVAKQKALRYLARRDYSRVELQRKLEAQLKPSINQKKLIAKILGELAHLGLQSDERFIEAFVRHRFNKGLGPGRILLELHSYGIESDAAKSYLAGSELNQFDNLYRVWSKKYKQKPQNYSEKAKQERFLRYRGFDSEQIKNFWLDLENQKELDSR